MSNSVNDVSLGFRFLLSTMFLMLAGTAFAQDGDDVDRLKKQLAQVNQELRETKRKLDQAIAGGFLPNEKGFSSVVEILKSLPPNLALDAKSPWDLGQREDAVNWLNQNMIGKSFKCNVVINDVKVRENPPYAKDRTAPKYVVLISTNTEEFAFNGYAISQVTAPTNQEFRFFGDDEVAERARKLKSGKRYEIEGFVQELDVTTRGKNQCQIHVRFARLLFPAMEK